jgi:hypothetical protein
MAAMVDGYLDEGDTVMKTRNTLVVVLIGLMLAASGGALAQGAGGGNGSAGGGSNSTGNTPAGASDERGGNAYPDQSASGTGSTSHKSMQRSHTIAHPKTKKPMNDTTNTPGADASSDTKGQ